MSRLPPDWSSALSIRSCKGSRICRTRHSQIVRTNGLLTYGRRLAALREGGFTIGFQDSEATSGKSTRQSSQNDSTFLVPDQQSSASRKLWASSSLICLAGAFASSRGFKPGVSRCRLNCSSGTATNRAQVGSVRGNSVPPTALPRGFAGCLRSGDRMT
jgi:hypothetical protein